MRIVSLLPSATEILFELGLGEQVVGVSHECDFPAEARSRRVVIQSRMPHDATPGEIDRLVREYVGRGESLYAVDAEALESLKPDLIVTQDLCQVCAASPDDLATALTRFARRPQVLCLNPQDLGDVWRDILWVGEETRRGCEAERLLEAIGERLAFLGNQIDCVERCPRAAILEWLDPFYVAGHWAPEMIEVAGGKDVLGRKRTPSFRVTPQDVLAADPEILLIAQCGYNATQARDEYLAMSFPKAWNEMAAVRNSRVFALNATSYLSRPGPRLITGIEALAKILHPEIKVSEDAERAAIAIPILAMEETSDVAVRGATA
jgi:iron complex transport system substrate-binding protein